MNWQGSQEGAVLWQSICVSMQPCLADSGIDWTSQRQKLDALALAKIGTASTPLELGAAETRLNTPCYPSPVSNPPSWQHLDSTQTWSRWEYALYELDSNPQP